MFVPKINNIVYVYLFFHTKSNIAAEKESAAIVTSTTEPGCTTYNVYQHVYIKILKINWFVYCVCFFTENVTTTQANENESGSFTKISNIIRTTSFFDNTSKTRSNDFCGQTPFGP